MPEHNDKTIAHMNMIQGVITRLESNCFTLKAMAMTMAAALLAFLGAIENPNWIYPSAVCLPVVVFWAMDAQYLRLGRCFRHLFNSVRKQECIDAFSMDISQFKQNEQSVIRIMFSWSVSLFYMSILVAFIFSMVVFLSRNPDFKNTGAKATPAITELRQGK